MRTLFTCCCNWELSTLDKSISWRYIQSPTMIVAGTETLNFQWQSNPPSTALSRARYAKSVSISAHQISLFTNSIITYFPFRCRCPKGQVNRGPLCEFTRVNYEFLNQPLEVKANYSLSLPIEISLDFVNNDFRGTGPLLTLGDSVSCCCCCCLGIAPRAKMLKISAWLLHPKW